MLLEEIIDLAADSKQSIATLLRKCIILGHRLNNDKLSAWANRELKGYGKDDLLPDYRRIPIVASGTFLGPFGSQLKTPIPPTALDKSHRHWAEEALLTQGIFAYEEIVKSAKTITIQWPPDFVFHYHDRIVDGMHLHSAYQEIPKSAILELLDTVRTRVLNLALEIQSEVGTKDSDLVRMEPARESRINQTIVQHIYGGQGFASTGHSTMAVHQQTLTHNWENLATALHASGISKSEVDELSGSVKQDGKTMGVNVRGWIAKTAPKVLSAGVSVGTAVGQTILTEFLKQYYGLN